jgi:glycosyltransferase involved in cell wall biosynthesis
MSRPHVVIIVQNLPVPLDRRVWLECQALVEAGFEVSVICPKAPGDRRYAVLKDVHLYKYRPAPPSNRSLGYLWEFLYSWVRTAALTLAVWRRQRFDVLQACNPPDTYWLLARIWRIRGVRFVFDHHDLNPELFVSRFGDPTEAIRRLQLAALRLLERWTFESADRVISTNESYREIARTRGRVSAERIAVVRSGPDTTAMRPVKGDASLRRGGEHLIVYLGIMGPQDGVEVVLDVARRVCRTHGRSDVRFALLGFGDCYDDLRRLCSAMDLDGFVHFVGPAGPKEITEYLSAASIALSPDPMSPLNDVSTMNKTMEYMAYALPIVAFSLQETVVTGADCVAYAEPDDVEGFAAAVLALLDDPDRRASLGAAARRRVESELDWQAQRETYVSMYNELVGRCTGQQPPASGTISVASEAEEETGRDRWGHDLIDLHDDEGLRRFAADRVGGRTA